MEGHAEEQKMLTTQREGRSANPGSKGQRLLIGCLLQVPRWTGAVALEYVLKTETAISVLCFGQLVALSPLPPRLAPPWLGLQAPDVASSLLHGSEDPNPGLILAEQALYRLSCISESSAFDIY